MRIGIDLGGTKIEAIALGDGGVTLQRRRVSTPRGAYDATLAAIVGLVRSLEQELGHVGTVGVGMPGTLSRVDGRVKNSNSTWLIGRPFGDDLQRELGRPVRFANDANCFSLSEATDGAAAGVNVAFGVILGTGVGGGIVAHGRILEGPNGIAGEWGHNPLPWPRDDERPGPPCYCGRSACIETFLSGPGLTLAYGSDVPALEIAQRAQQGESHAQQCLADYEHRLARALASVINLLDPDAIVLGGGLSNIASLYESIPKIWPAFVFSDRIDTKLLPAKHGDSSGVRGAAWLWE